ncbi:MAG: aspartate 1-decarboxylase [Candidatus Pacebacteria bacterium]|nr:aspartate 1-decarboxylase [Candidatus Paceibacterota bacterium]
MNVQILKNKIHQARITECELMYEGSLGIDRDLMDAAGIIPYEKLLIVNATNGERLETYAIPEERGSKTFCLNGAAARRGSVGDTITIMTFASLDADTARQFEPTIIILDEKNNIIRRKKPQG